LTSRRQILTTVALLAPALVLLGLVAVYPLARVAALSFFATEHGFEGARFVGLQNYVDLIDDRFFRRAAWNTLVFSLLATASEVGLGLLLALLVNPPFPGRRLVIVTLVLPYVLSTMVVTAIWRAWFHFDFGFLNNVLRAAGAAPLEWLSSRDLALYALVLVDLWQTAPFTFLILLAGLQSIPTAIYEAAQIDGASPRAAFWAITAPLLVPHVAAAALLRSIDTFKVFDKVYALTGGGPGLSTESLSTLTYKMSFRFSDIGHASAAAVIMIAIAGALGAVYAWRAADRSGP